MNAITDDIPQTNLNTCKLFLLCNLTIYCSGKSKDDKIEDLVLCSLKNSYKFLLPYVVHEFVAKFVFMYNTIYEIFWKYVWMGSFEGQS